ncbi:MAG: hypothetical protein E6J61_06005 [Deltaproteobacteria bacterium]|nr:MAG: hypothetical protein E6J61_06005 [Deltaproteobacteria bacterium]
MRLGLQREIGETGRHRGPSLAAVAGVYAILVLVSVAVPTAMASGRHFPSPFDPGAPDWFAEYPSAALASAFLIFCSAVPLGIFTATASSRLQFLGMKVAGIHIALVGGVAASVALATSAFAAWALAQAGGPDARAVAHALHMFSFAAGGPGFVVPFGLLVAGVSVVAGLQRFTPRWLMVAGLAIAAIAELSVLTFVWPAAAILLPIVRFTGLLWMVGIGIVIPTSRAPRAQPAPIREASAGAAV